MHCLKAPPLMDSQMTQYTVPHITPPHHTTNHHTNHRTAAMPSGAEPQGPIAAAPTEEPLPPPRPPTKRPTVDGHTAVAGAGSPCEESATVPNRPGRAMPAAAEIPWHAWGRGPHVQRGIPPSVTAVPLPCRGKCARCSACLRESVQRVRGLWLRCRPL